MAFAAFSVEENTGGQNRDMRHYQHRYVGGSCFQVGGEPVVLGFVEVGVVPASVGVGLHTVEKNQVPAVAADA